MSKCDLCQEEVLPGQPRRGGQGDGGRSGAPAGFERHWTCHEAKYGRAEPVTVFERPSAPPRAPRRPVLRPKVKSGPYNRSLNALREWRHTGAVISEMGRRRIEIECPFCFSVFWAFVWSLSGGGKKCPNCGAMHTSHGNAYPIEGNESLETEDRG